MSLGTILLLAALPYAAGPSTAPPAPTSALEAKAPVAAPTWMTWEEAVAAQAEERTRARRPDLLTDDDPR